MEKQSQQNTTPNPPEDEAATPCKPARAPRRLIAFMLDSVIVALFHFTLAQQMWYLTGLFYILYHGISVFATGRTLGKAILALVVRAADGGRPSWWKALLRPTIGYLASGFFLLGFLRALVDPQNRTWHDLYFGTVVLQQEAVFPFTRLVERIDRWSSDMLDWYERKFARFERLQQLVDLAAKLTFLDVLIQWLVSKFTTSGNVVGADNAATGTAVSASGAAAATATVLAVGTVVTYVALAPPLFTHIEPYKGIIETGATTGFNDLTDVAVAPDGTLFIADAGGHRIYSFTPAGQLRIVAGTGKDGFAGDGGMAPQAKLDGPTGVALGPKGSIYIADLGNNRVRRVRPNGHIETVAGGGETVEDISVATEAKLSDPYDVAVGSDGALYIADTHHHRIRRVINNVTTIVAGTGEQGFSGDGNLAVQAKLNHPDGIAVSSNGTLFIFDRENNRIRRVNPQGIIETIAGGGSGAGENLLATNVSLDYYQPPRFSGMCRGCWFPPSGVALAADGSLYFSDNKNNLIRRVDKDGTITTAAGGGDEKPQKVLATQAKLSDPGGLALHGNSLYVTDAPDHVLRVANGIIDSVPLTATDQ